MERYSKERRDLEAYCSGGQGPPLTVVPSGGGYIHTNIYEKLRGRSEILVSSFINSLLYLFRREIGPEIEMNVVLDVVRNAVHEV